MADVVSQLVLQEGIFVFSQTLLAAGKEHKRKPWPNIEVLSFSSAHLSLHPARRILRYFNHRPDLQEG